MEKKIDFVHIVAHPFLRMATMADIALRAGVSASTVSRALKGHPRISKDTRIRIQRIAKELNYQPNPLVRALMESRRGSKTANIATLAFVTDDCGQKDWRNKPTRERTFAGVTRRAKELGYRIDVVSTRDLNMERNQLEKILMARGIPGVIFGFSRLNSPPFSFDTSNFATVGLTSYFDFLSVDRVKMNGSYNVKLGIEKLRDHGYTKVGLVVPAYNNELVDGNWTAAALEDARTLPKKTSCPPLVIKEDKSAEKVFSDWFDRHQPEALLVYKIPVLPFLKSKKIRIGKDVGLAWIFREVSPKFAGVNTNYEDSGAALVDLLVSKLHTNDFGSQKHCRSLLVDGYWVEGPSVGDQHYSIG